MTLLEELGRHEQKLLSELRSATLEETKNLCAQLIEVRSQMRQLLMDDGMEFER